MRFDVVLRSPQFAHIRAAGTIPLGRLYQAAAVPGVDAAIPLYVGNGTLQEPESHLRREVVVLAVDPVHGPFKLPDSAAAESRLSEDDTAVMDEATRTDYDKVRVGQIWEIENRAIRIVGTYHYGTGFVGDASIFVSDQTFSRLFGGYPLSDVSLGLVRLAPGADMTTVISQLKAALPDDVQVMPRRELEGDEQRLWVRIRPCRRHVQQRRRARPLRRRGDRLSDSLVGDHEPPEGIRHAQGDRPRLLVHPPGRDPAGRHVHPSWAAYRRRSWRTAWTTGSSARRISRW